MSVDDCDSTVALRVALENRSLNPGDGLFTWHVYNNQQKPWVAQLVVPYLVLFGVAAVASAYTIIEKSKLLLQIFRRRHEDHGGNPAHDEADAAWRRQWIAAFESQQQTYSEAEKAAIASALQLLGTCAVGVGQSRTTLDRQTNRLVGASTLTIPDVRPEQVVAYLMHADSHAVRSSSDPKVTVRFEVLERANGHQLVSWMEVKHPPLHNRTLLNMVVSQKLSADVWVCAMVPLRSHARIGPEDEHGRVRAEGTRFFRCSAAPESEAGTLLEYVAWLDLKGHLPAWFAERVVAQQLMRLPNAIKRYGCMKIFPR
jgi:hypothetical protein